MSTSFATPVPDVVTTHPDWWTELDTKAVDTARLLAADAVQKAGNGHPGTAMSLAPLAYLLYQRVMRHDPMDPNWVARDRFILSNGHSSLTQYCQLFLSGYGLELADIEALRTWGSLTPGHPEHGHTAGHRGHHRTARSGRRQRRRHGHGRPPRARPVRPEPRRGPVGLRPPHLRHRRRRLHGRGRGQRGVLARRPPAARQPHPVLRRQPHLDRGRHRGRVQRGRPRSATRAYGWHTQRVDSGEDIVALEAAIEAAKAETDQAVDHRRPHDHRLAGAGQAEHRRRPRLRARRGRDPQDQGDPRLRPRRALRRRSRRCSSTPARSSSAAATRTPSGRRTSTPGPSATPNGRPCSTG